MNNIYLYLSVILLIFGAGTIGKAVNDVNPPITGFVAVIVGIVIILIETKVF